MPRVSDPDSAREEVFREGAPDADVDAFAEPFALADDFGAEARDDAETLRLVGVREADDCSEVFAIVYTVAVSVLRSFASIQPWMALMI